jgi:hypothetical protein
MADPNRQDDASIRDEERLLRRVHLMQLVQDEDTGCVRVSSGAFKDRELSVDLESVLTECGVDVRDCLQGHPAHKLVGITAQVARLHGQIVYRDPVPENPAHAIVYGNKNSKTVHEGLRSASAWVVPPAPPLWADIRAERQALGID